MFTRSIFEPSTSTFNRCSKDCFSLGSIYLVLVFVCATLKDKSDEAEIRRLYTGNVKLESNTAINASPMGMQPRFHGLSSSRPSERGERVSPLSLGREDERPWERG